MGEITEETHVQMGQRLALDLAPMDLGEMVQTVVQDVAETNAARAECVKSDPSLPLPSLTPQPFRHLPPLLSNRNRYPSRP